MPVAGSAHGGREQPIIDDSTIRQGAKVMKLVRISVCTAKQFLWRGTGSDTVSDNPQKNEKKVSNALNKMFQKFPDGK
jgi:hypothetical protein